MFSDLYAAAEAAYARGASATPVRFLSRYDKSATNIKESQLFISIGQVPWATAYSTWYHQYIAFPVQALTAAIQLGEYTITDRGTWLTVGENVTQKATIYKAGSDDEADPLLNPAHLLIGQKAKNPAVAQRFADWLVSSQGGQKIIQGFEKSGEVLYSTAP
jgi:ABC-type tungstate transport system permease subunit